MDQRLFEPPRDEPRPEAVHMRGFRGPLALHAHPSFQFLLPIGPGAMRFELASGGAFELEAPAWALIWPGVEHGLAPTAGELEFLALHLGAEAMAAAWEMVEGTPPQTAPGWFLGSPDALLREVTYELVSQGEGRASEAAWRVTYGHLCLLVARAVTRAAVAPAPGLERPHFESPYVERAVAHMRAHLTDELSVGALARVAATSSRNLARHFQRELGMSPVQALTAMRLAEAAVRLRNTRDSITSVAYDVGYNSLSHFIHQFREQYGCSPGMYRDGHG